MAAEDKYREVAALFDMKEEQLKDILKEFEELKKNIYWRREGRKNEIRIVESQITQLVSTHYHFSLHPSIHTSRIAIKNHIKKSENYI